MNLGLPFRFVLVLIAAVLLTGSAFARTSTRPDVRRSDSKVVEKSKISSRSKVLRSSSRQTATYKSRSKKAVAGRSTARGKKKSRYARKRRYVERFKASSFAEDQTSGDVIDGEDPIVRAAAVEALGNMNGTIVAIDPTSGRVLAMVNQKLALSEGAQPCSTFKTAVALAALNEGVITKDTKVALGRRWKVDLTYALAHSNNAYFEVLGRKLGFEKVSHYAQQFGFGELAGWNIEGEHLGVFPAEELDARLGGVGKMCSFGESISLTPLQLGAFMASIANGGTLYYLQHPQTETETAAFRPRIKRHLDIAPLIPSISDGLLGTTQYGTGRSLRWNFSEEEVLGKTGTCSKDGTRFGWFGSYANTDYGKIVVVTFLKGGRPTFGPKAAEITGRMLRRLSDSNYFVRTTDDLNEKTRTVGATQ